MQHIGDLIITGEQATRVQVTGTTYVRAGGKLVAHGQLAGGLIVEAGGIAVVHGQVCRDIQNSGRLEVYGQVVGRILGKPPVNEIDRDQVVGNDLPMPFAGETISWRSS